MSWITDRAGNKLKTECIDDTVVPHTFVTNEVDVGDRSSRVLGHVVVDSLPVGGAGLTDNELRASPLEVSIVGAEVTLNVDDIDGVDISDRGGRLLGHVVVDSMPAGGAGLTDLELRATPIDVLGVVAVSNFPSSQPVTGPLTDTQLRAAALPVSAASLPLPSGAATSAKQDTCNTSLSSIDGKITACNTGACVVSSSALPTGASTEATLAAIKAKTDNLDVALSTRAVTGLTDAQLRAVAVPVSGTFYQATQPVSAASLPLPTGASTSAKQDTGNTSLSSIDGKVTACNTGAVVVSSSALPSGAATSAKQDTGNTSVASIDTKTPALVAGRVPVDGSGVTQPVSGTVTITPPTLTKGTQGATGVSTQDLKDAGRVLKTYTCTAVATVTSEALITLTPYADLVAGGGATTFPVTSGKRLRIQAIMLTVRSTSTVNIGGIIRFRMLAGTVLVGSPIHATLGTQCSNLGTAVSGNTLCASITFPDGLELSGNMQFGLTQLFQATSATIDVQVVGYEY